MKDSPARQRRIKKATRSIKREVFAAFSLFSTLAGALFFGYIAVQMTGTSQTTWPLLAVAGSIIALPKVFKKIKDSQEPYVIRFAHAFREGFVPMYSTAQNLPEFIGRLRTARGAAKSLKDQHPK